MFVTYLDIHTYIHTYILVVLAFLDWNVSRKSQKNYSLRPKLLVVLAFLDWNVSRHKYIFRCIAKEMYLEKKK
jgi:hypothetical protein